MRGDLDPGHWPADVVELAHLEQEKLDRLMDHAPAGVSRADGLAFLRRREAERERRGLHA